MRFLNLRPLRYIIAKFVVSSVLWSPFSSTACGQAGKTSCLRSMATSSAFSAQHKCLTRTITSIGRCPGPRHSFIVMWDDGDQGCWYYRYYQLIVSMLGISDPRTYAIAGWRDGNASNAAFDCNDVSSITSITHNNANTGITRRYLDLRLLIRWLHWPWPHVFRLSDLSSL